MAKVWRRNIAENFNRIQFQFAFCSKFTDISQKPLSFRAHSTLDVYVHIGVYDCLECRDGLLWPAPYTGDLKLKHTLWTRKIVHWRLLGSQCSETRCNCYVTTGPDYALCRSYHGRAPPPACRQGASDQLLIFRTLCWRSLTTNK